MPITNIKNATSVISKVNNSPMAKPETQSLNKLIAQDKIIANDTMATQQSNSKMNDYLLYGGIAAVGLLTIYLLTN